MNQRRFASIKISGTKIVRSAKPHTDPDFRPTETVRRR